MQRRGGERVLRGLKEIPLAIPLAMLVGLCLVAGLVNPRFLTPGNLGAIAQAAAIPLIVGMAETLVIISGSIDLSVEGAMALTAVVVSLLVKNGRTDADFGWLAIAAALLVGLGIGLLNGVLHARLQIPSFMVTLGVWFSAIGATFILYGGNPVPVRDLGLRQFAIGTWGGVPSIALVALALFLLAYFVQGWTRLGRYAFAIGGDERLAAAVGVPVRHYKILIFVFAGLYVAIGGVLSAFRLGAGSATVGRGMLFQTAAAVVVGGTALTGGVGGMANTAIGVLLITVLSNALILLNVNSFFQLAVQGAVLVIAVAITLDRNKIGILK